MSNKPKALLIADELENGDTYESHSRPVYGWECRSGDPCQGAADELRRLHALNAQMLEALQRLLVRVADDEEYGPGHAITKARAAIAAATGGES